MSVEFWSAACSSSVTRPLSQQLEQNAGGYWFAIFMYSAAALFSGYWMFKYYSLRLSEGRGLHVFVWSWLGIFLFVVFLASLSGAVTRAGWMSAAEFRFRRDYATTRQQFYLLDRDELLVYQHYRIFRAIETPFLNVVELMVLSRLTNHVYTMKSSDDAEKSDSTLPKIGLSQLSKKGLKTLFKAITILVSLSSAVGIASSFASAKYLSDICESLLNAALKCDVNGSNTDLSRSFFSEANLTRKLSGQSFFIQSLSDIFCIFLISAMFSVVGSAALYSLRRARLYLENARSKVQVLKEGDTVTSRLTGSFPVNGTGVQDSSFTIAKQGKQMATDMVDGAIRVAGEQRKRYVFSYVSVVVAFIVRSLFIMFVGIQAFTADAASSSNCGRCGNCLPLGTLIGTWYVYNTMFSGILFALSTPVSFCVSGDNPIHATSPSATPTPPQHHCCFSVWCMMSNQERLVLHTGRLYAGNDAETTGRREEIIGQELLVTRLGLALRPEQNREDPNYRKI